MAKRDIFTRRVDNAGGIADKNQGDARLYRYHHPEHPRAVRLRRGLKRGSRQQAKDEPVA